MAQDRTHPDPAMNRSASLRARMRFALLAFGCHGDGFERLPVTPGGVCSSLSVPRCTSEDRLFVCIDRAWVVKSQCGTVCDDLEIDAFEDECILADRENACACGDGDPCGERQTHCGEPEELRVCEAGEWESVDCIDVCGTQEPPRESLGCIETMATAAACSCTLEGTPCATDRAHCDGPSSLAVCSEGRWVIDPCACPEPARSVCRDTGEPTCGCVTP